MTYNELLASPDLQKAAQELSAKDLRDVCDWLAQGVRKGWVADRVQGICILEKAARWDIDYRLIGDHGSEIGRDATRFRGADHEKQEVIQ